MGILQRNTLTRVSAGKSRGIPEGSTVAMLVNVTGRPPPEQEANSLLGPEIKGAAR